MLLFNASVSLNREYKVLNLLEFESTRKRMSVIVQDEDGQIYIFCKGADRFILFNNMFKPAANQVAGHKAGSGKPGPVVDSSGKFYKPLQDGERGLREKNFYEQFFADESVPSNIKSFFPTYCGVVEIEASDGSGLLEHLILEDLTHNYQKPCVIDLKMGTQTWYPGASDKYVAKCVEKDKESTSPILGFRVSGLQVYDTVTAKLWKPSREWCKLLDVNDTKGILMRFVSTNPTNDENHDAALAPKVYGGSRGLINQLKELQHWFQTQITYHFYSSSVLFMYESNESPDADLLPCVRMVDFAHVLTDDPSIDENVLKGLDSLINMLEEIISSDIVCDDILKSCPT